MLGALDLGTMITMGVTALAGIGLLAVVSRWLLRP